MKKNYYFISLIWKWNTAQTWNYEDIVTEDQHPLDYLLESRKAGEEDGREVHLQWWTKISQAAYDKFKGEDL